MTRIREFFEEYFPFVVVAALVAGAAGRGWYIYSNTSWGPQQRVEGRVADLHWVPEQWHTWTTFDGDGNAQTHTDFTPAQFNVRIGWEYGAFTWDNRRLFESVKVGDPVFVFYRDCFWKGQPWGQTVDDVQSIRGDW